MLEDVGGMWRGTEFTMSEATVVEDEQHLHCFSKMKEDSLTKT